MASLIDSLPSGSVVVSGGCRGVDTWAAEAARAAGLDVVEHRPNLDGVRSRGEASRRYHDRNSVVIDGCDSVIALVAEDRRGGTEDTIRKALAAGKPVRVVFADGTQQQF